MENTTATSMTPPSPLPYTNTLMHTKFLLVLLPVISSVLLLLGARRGKKWPAVVGNGNRLPPSPWRLPVIGNLHQLGRLPHRSLRALAASHGPVMLLRLGQVPAVVVSSADAAREVMQAQDHVFASRPSLTIPRRLLYGCTDIAFAPHGPYWRGARKMSVRHLLSPARVRACRAVREQEVAALVRRVAEHGAGVVRLSELLNGFAKDVAGRIVLGVRAAGDSGWRARVDALLEESNALLAAFHVGDYVPWLSWVSAVDGTDARVRRAFQRIDRILDEIVDAAAATGGEISPSSAVEEADGEAFIHVLLSLQQKDDEAPGTAEWRLTRDNVKALLEDLFGAGTEATIIVLEWAMAELLRNKEAMHKLQLEVRRQARTTSNHSNLIREQDLPGMEYLRAVIKETMRLHTPGPLLLPHKSMEATRLGGGRYDVPSGTTVIVNAWAIGRDPSAWESPEEFRPERFVGSAVDFRGRHFQLIPFGAGRRMCPGVNLAMAVVELALANLVARFDWALPDGEPVMDMEETPGCTSWKRAPLRAVATQHYC
ncbi:LOW QUALITY PROTEIN: cytochrome P450 71A1-like [Setaria italica]|uniref:LOW QUALITY PROTEIN: cytochrome P450 71A1-like n=1 Tax=Setaria italica TaxID=4555 RepID=UPI000648A944|nr:LOW QUALITY PROTEIN: cytochrome P450 71A1-like [Setaria italica]